MSRRRGGRGDPHKEPEPMSELAQRALRSMAGEARADLVEVLAVWRPAVGDRIADVARPRRVADGVLTVAVASPVWSQQLSLMAPQLIGALNTRLGREMVRELRFSPDSDRR